ncbi:Internalin-I [Wickerhamomyces ciferrii]|uniref:Internalin-I n=1 Tax=Wickerhamomyces ciferrii (strain ATCC 14091 / BCRC 22168 / CBS 111 / JCM 3599 / NBRC 0793 / NRRL Y-1031 F-60-10) TaxID=1206466 RepID=K0KJ74_WICCF|nr:Internalin-I [Wickerhamomyces ciferrii]CCH41163.1 Internalin-I [Wickerhamomyces ciferrii]
MVNFTELPTEIHSSIFQHLYPSDFIKIIQNIPEWEHLITPDMFRIVSNDYSSFKSKYGLSDDFYLDYNCNINPNVDRHLYLQLLKDYFEIERDNSVLDPSLLMGFNGALLIEINESAWECLTKFDDHLLLHDPIELIWNTTKLARARFKFLHDFFPNLECITRLKKLTINLGPEIGYQSFLETPYEIQDLPYRIPSNKLHIPFVKSLHLGFEEIRGLGGYYGAPEGLDDEIRCHSINEIKTIMPDLESLNMSFNDVNDDYEDESGCTWRFFNPILGFDEDWEISSVDERSKLDDFFETIEGSLDFLKSFQLRYFHNKNFKLFNNLQVSNLEKLVIEFATIHSIKNLNLPNLKSFEINQSVIYEISNLKLNSLEDFSIQILTPHFTLEEEQKNEVHVTIQNIKSSSLKNFTLFSSFKIKEISNLDFPSLQTMKIHPTSDSANYDSFEGIKNLSFPKLEDLTIFNIPFDNLYSLFQGCSDLKHIHMVACSSFNIKKIRSQNSLESLSLRGIESLQGFDGISLPSLQTMCITAGCETSFSMENCSFENLKTLAIYTEYPSSDYSSTLTFLNNDIPQLEQLSLSGFNITNHFSTEPYPELEGIKIDRIKSIQISASNKLKMLNLWDNFTSMKIDKSDELPNLQTYREPCEDEYYETVFKKRKIELGEDVY